MLLKVLEVGYDLIIETLKKNESVIEIDLAVTWADFWWGIERISLVPEVMELKSEIQNQLTEPCKSTR